MRSHFLISSVVLVVITAMLSVGCSERRCDTKEESDLRNELIAAWRRSEMQTLAIVEQMPAESFGFRSTPETMTFAEQWRHCVLFTCAQLAGRMDVENPYAWKRPPKDLPKDSVIVELKRMYAFVLNTIAQVPEDKLNMYLSFAGDDIPGWRLFYAMENHIIHHRGQCIVYLRLKGIKPKGYLGW